jgi:hypothetical protein
VSRQRFISLVVAAVLAISGALYLSTQRNLPRDLQGTAFLPSLANELNTVTALSVRRGRAIPSVTVHQQSGRWTVAELGDYPADVSKLRKLLLALSDAKIIEEKTSNPASFPIIGVEDPSSLGAAGAEIRITAKDGKHAVIIGKPTGEGNFARRAGEKTSYIVEPGISFEAEPRYWIDSHLIDIPAASIQSIEVKPAAGPAYTIHRANPAAGAGSAPGSPAASGAGAGASASAAPNSPVAAGSGAVAGAGAAVAGNFVLDGVPVGRKAADPAVLAPSPTTFGGLTADDVTTVGDIDFSKATVATVTLSDGSVITVTGATSGDKHWVHLQTSKDAALNAKAAGRAFEIAGYRYDAIFRPLEQLLVPKESLAAKKGSSPTATTDGSPGHAASKKRLSAPPP